MCCRTECQTDDDSFVRLSVVKRYKGNCGKMQLCEQDFAQLTCSKLQNYVAVDLVVTTIVLNLGSSLKTRICFVAVDLVVYFDSLKFIKTTKILILFNLLTKV